MSQCQPPATGEKRSAGWGQPPPPHTAVCLPGGGLGGLPGAARARARRARPWGERAAARGIENIELRLIPFMNDLPVKNTALYLVVNTRCKYRLCTSYQAWMMDSLVKSQHFCGRWLTPMCEPSLRKLILGHAPCAAAAVAGVWCGCGVAPWMAISFRPSCSDLIGAVHGRVLAG